MARRRRRCRSLAITSFPDMTSQINAESLAALEIIKFPGENSNRQYRKRSIRGSRKPHERDRSGHRYRDTPLFQKRYHAQRRPRANIDMGHMLSVQNMPNKQYPRHKTDSRIDWHSENRIVIERRLHRIASPVADNPASLHRTATICDGIRYRRNELTKNLCTSFREKNFKNTTTIQLGSPGVDKRPTALCGNRCMGLPPYLQSPQRRPPSRRISENIPDSPTERKRQTFYPEITSS